MVVSFIGGVPESTTNDHDHDSPCWVWECLTHLSTIFQLDHDSAPPVTVNFITQNVC